MKPLSILLGLVLLLSGCTNVSAEKSTLVVSSQNYANIAKSLMGESPAAQFDVHVLLSNDAVDPHEFEPSAKDKLAVSQAAAVFYAGSDFDSFVDPLLNSVNFNQDNVVNSYSFVQERLASCATELCLEKGRNPHLWFDLDVIAKSAEALTALYIKLKPDQKSEFEKAAATFQNNIKVLKDKQDQIAEKTKNLTFFAPEAIANVLLMEIGLANVSSKQISDKIANEVELSLLEMQQTKEQLKAQKVSVFVANQQVESEQAQQLQDSAQSANVPVIYFGENSLCVNKSDKFLDCFSSKMDEITQVLGLAID